jgi:hypothetical protein
MIIDPEECKQCKRGNGEDNPSGACEGTQVGWGTRKLRG